MKESLNNQIVRLQVLSTLVSRMGFAAQLTGQAFEGQRNLYEALGYPTELTFADYYARYKRQDIAKAIIDRPVKATWQGDFKLQETNDEKETPTEKAWKDLFDDFRLKNILIRLDKLTGLGKFGILLFGLSDIHVVDDWKTPAARNAKLLYLRPFSEGSVTISQYETDPNNKRYGKPKLYSITLQQTEEGRQLQLKVHFSRVLHVVDDILESDIEGSPRLESVFNRLMDLEKIVGGDSEIFWKGARPGYTGKVDPDYQLSEEQEEKLKEQLDEYEHNLRRFLVNEGVDYKALTQQIADPVNHVDIQLQMISAQTGIPKRILTGSERAHLSSTQDVAEWKTYISSRREHYAEPMVLRPFIDKCIELGILPKPKDRYSIAWDDLFALSEKEKVEIGKSRTEALRAYTANVLAGQTIPPEAFIKYFLGLDDEQMELIKEMQDAQVAEESPITPTEQKIIDTKQ